jgi:hypothetical protein
VFIYSNNLTQKRYFHIFLKKGYEAGFATAGHSRVYLSR